MKIVPNINAQVYTISAFVIGLLLLDDSTPSEQNSLGNWFMMIGQVLCTNSAQQQLLNNRNRTANSSNDQIVSSDSTNSQSDNPDNENDELQNQINMMQKVINAMEIEINELKKKNHLNGDC